MKIEKIPLHLWKKTFRQVISDIYSEDQSFKNNKEGIFSLVCNPRLSFYRKSKQEMIIIRENGIIQCFSVLICHEARSQVLCLSFFEARENAMDAVAALVNYAKNLGSEWGCKQLAIGLEGHCNYGLGFLYQGTGLHGQKTPSFGEAYSPLYYKDLLKEYHVHKYISFYDTIVQVKRRVSVYMERFEDAKHQYTFDYASFHGKGFVASMKRYTDLNNTIFAGHTSYFHRDYCEDIELFKSMAPLLNKENLIFIQKSGKDIGFILWYPDFNELVQVGKGAGLSTFFRYRVLKQMPSKVKIVEIGVDPRFRHSPAILFLFNAVIEATKHTSKYTHLISSWIDEANVASSRVTEKFAHHHYKEFVTYEKNI